MSTVAQSQNQQPKAITSKDLISWAITLGIILMGYFGTMRINEAILNTKFNDFKESATEKDKYINERLDKQDQKLDLIINGMHNIELQLKDKADRP